MSLLEDFESDVDLTGTLGQPPIGHPLNSPPAETFANHSSDVEGLLYLGYLTSDFDLLGHSFTIRTLRRGERLAIAQIAQEWEATIGFADAMEAAHVAACIVLVDGRSLSAALGTEEEKSPITWIRRNFAVVNRWYDPVLEGIYTHYSNLLVRQSRAFLELEGK